MHLRADHGPQVINIFHPLSLSLSHTLPMLTAARQSQQSLEADEAQKAESRGRAPQQLGHNLLRKPEHPQAAGRCASVLL